MKCVKNKSGKISRVKDWRADFLVKNEGCTYCSKSDWRAADPEYTKRKPKKTREVSK